MFLKPSNSVFFLVLIISTMMVVSSGSWLNAWLALEVNLMSMIPILINTQSYNTTSSAIKYFMTQAMASMLLMLMMMIYYNMNVMMSMNINNEIILISLAMKSGIPPFHFWLPQVVESSEILQTFFILSWQKIAPFMMFTYCLSNIIFIMIFLSAMIGAIGGINQNSMKKVLTYSSMTHGAWMIFSMMVKQNLWLIYFMIYNMSLMVVCLIMDKFSLKKISDNYNSKIIENVKMVFMLNMLSMAGLPPFLGFFGKMLVITSMVYSAKMIFSLSMMLTASLISLMYYIKVCYSSYLMNEKKMFFKKNYLKSSSMLMALLVMNMLGPIMVYLT